MYVFVCVDVLSVLFCRDPDGVLFCIFVFSEKDSTEVVFIHNGFLISGWWPASY